MSYVFMNKIVWNSPGYSTTKLKAVRSTFLYLAFVSTSSPRWVYITLYVLYYSEQWWYKCATIYNVYLMVNINHNIRYLCMYYIHIPNILFTRNNNISHISFIKLRNGEIYDVKPSFIHLDVGIVIFLRKRWLISWFQIIMCNAGLNIVGRVITTQLPIYTVVVC